MRRYSQPWEVRLTRRRGLMSDRDEIPRYLENWQDEVDSAAEYRAMAAAEADPRLAKVYSNLAAMEAVDQNAYLKQPETAGTRMPAHERWHAKVLEQLVTSQPRGLQGTFLGRLEGRHRSVGGNAMRAAVLGAN